MATRSTNGSNGNCWSKYADVKGIIIALQKVVMSVAAVKFEDEHSGKKGVPTVVRRLKATFMTIDSNPLADDR